MRIMLLALLFSIVSNAQDTVEYKRNLIKTTLTEFFKDTDKQTFNAYTDSYNLNIDIEYEMNFKQQDVIDYLGYEKLDEKTRDLIYSIAAQISESILMNQIKEADYANIVFNVTCVTHDKNIIGQYYVNVRSLLDLAGNINKSSFNNMLKKEFLR